MQSRFHKTLQFSYYWAYVGPYRSIHMSSSGFICLHSHSSHPPFWYFFGVESYSLGCRLWSFNQPEAMKREKGFRDGPESSCHTRCHPIAAGEVSTSSDSPARVLASCYLPSSWSKKWRKWQNKVVLEFYRIVIWLLAGENKIFTHSPNVLGTFDWCFHTLFQKVGLDYDSPVNDELMWRIIENN